MNAGNITKVEHNESLLVFNQTTYGIIYEFCAGNDLFNYVINKTTVMNHGICSTIFAQIVNGVAFMHSKKVCHYDLKLENIVFDGDFNAKIIDFGLSDFTNIPVTKSKGTAGYLAPEIYQL